MSVDVFRRMPPAFWRLLPTIPFPDLSPLGASSIPSFSDPMLPRLVVALLMASCLLPLHAQLVDITAPGDPIVATSDQSPANEGVALAIDDLPTKYLNFDRLNAGLTVTPRSGLTVVQGLTLTSANDSPERDPSSYELSGSIDGVNFTRIANGQVAFSGRFDKQSLPFANEVPYTSYRLIFPTVAGPGGNSMQISEVELLGVLGVRRTLSRGFLKFEKYDTGGGNEVALLTSHPSFPDSPTEVLHLTSFDSRTVYPDDSRENYGARISGYFIPEVSGAWIFYLRSDDTSVLFLNPNGMNPAGKILLTQEAAWGQSFSSHASAPQNLVAGRAYYIEALYKEGVGGDYCQVAAKLSTDPTNPDALSPIPGHRLAALADPNGVRLEWARQPVVQRASVPSPGLDTDFNQSNGGFTVTTPRNYAGPWVYDPASGSWRQDGQAVEIGFPTTSFLNSPILRVSSLGRVLVSFAHRYSFEDLDSHWDGGQVRVSRNGGPFVAVPDSAFTQNGYAGQRVLGISRSELKGQEAFTADSAGYTDGFITSVADLGEFEAGDTVQVQFMAAGDTNTGGKIPNWQIDSVEVDWVNLSPVFAAQARPTMPGVVNPPVFYQWEQDCGEGFVPIPGANSATYSPAADPSLHACQFRVQAYTVGASATSDSTRLVVFDARHGLPVLTGVAFDASGNANLTGTGTPGMIAGLATSSDLVNWVWLEDALVRHDGEIQRTAATGGDPQRFFLLDWAQTRPFPRNLAVWWRAEGNYLDAYGTNHASPAGAAPTFEAGIRGRAFRFDGFGRGLVAPPASLPVPWTAAFWVNRENAPDPSAALLADAESALKLEQADSNRQMGFTQFGVADYGFDYVLPANTWSHVVFVASALGTQLYVDGVLVGTRPETVYLPLSTVGARPRASIA
jgi:Concanavalin A-like lectin/glucanases superfamily/PA14 domain